MAFESAAESVACPVDPYCLGMCSWMDCPGNADRVNPTEPHPANESLLLPPIESSTSASAYTPSNHSAEPHPLRFAVASDQELAKLAEGLIPANTVKKNKLGCEKLSAMDGQQKSVRLSSQSRRHFAIF